MSTLDLRSLRPELASKLSELEVGAAVLERDARNGRAILIELGLAPPPRRNRFFGWRATLSRSLTNFRAASRAAIRCLAWIGRIVGGPRLATALRVLRGWLSDGVKCVSLACAMLVALTFVVLLVAPPD